MLNKSFEKIYYEKTRNSVLFYELMHIKMFKSKQRKGNYEEKQKRT